MVRIFYLDDVFCSSDNWLFARGADVQFTSFRECQPCGKDKNGNDVPEGKSIWP